MCILHIFFFFCISILRRLAAIFPLGRLTVKSSLGKVMFKEVEDYEDKQEQEEQGKEQKEQGAPMNVCSIDILH